MIIQQTYGGNMNKDEKDYKEFLVNPEEDEEYQEFLKKIELAKKETEERQLKDKERMKQLHEFESTYAYYFNLRNLYMDKLDDFRNEVAKNEAYKQYSKGGETIHRGYYYPGLVLDLIAKGASRGHLYKRMPQNAKYSYEYTFDENGRMIKVIKRQGDKIPPTEEYFVYEKDTIISFIFGDGLEGISKCDFKDDNLIMYTFVRFRFWEKSNSIAEYSCEKYSYENGLFKVSNRYTIRYASLANERVSYFEHCREIFERDEEGYIDHYIGGVIENGEMIEPGTYGVLYKRK